MLIVNCFSHSAEIWKHARNSCSVPPPSSSSCCNKYRTVSSAQQHCFEYVRTISGDLTSNVTETGLGELHAKRVARQLAAAVHHIHSRELVHRDIKLDNILVFRSDFSRIKLCDFGETRRTNTVVRRHNEWLPYSPPEVLQIDTDETYK